MWLFAATGFYSVVQKPGETRLTVRTRVRSDLDRLREKYMPELSETFVDVGTDYRYRAFIDHAAFGRGLARIGEDVHYPNFKGEVARTQTSRRAAVYSSAWTALWELLKEDDAEEEQRRVLKARRAARVGRSSRSGS
jgi:hypothetical protein